MTKNICYNLTTYLKKVHLISIQFFHCFLEFVSFLMFILPLQLSFILPLQAIKHFQITLVFTVTCKDMLVIDPLLFW